VQTSTVPERRIALVVATTAYRDDSLGQLRSPSKDADDPAAVLADPAIGGFAVRSLIDSTAHEIRVAVEGE
jgi:hypothetical protein